MKKGIQKICIFNDKCLTFLFGSKKVNVTSPIFCIFVRVLKKLSIFIITS